MICKKCARAADRGMPRSSHCRDEKCPCQHRTKPAEPEGMTVLPLSALDSVDVVLEPGKPAVFTARKKRSTGAPLTNDITGLLALGGEL